MNLKKKKKVHTLLVRMLSERMTEHAKLFSPCVFAYFNKVYEPTEDLAIKGMYVETHTYKCKEWFWWSLSICLK